MTASSAPAEEEHSNASLKEASRELATSRTPLARRKARFTLLPAVVQTAQPSAPATLTAASPTPPVPACTSTCGIKLTGLSSQDRSQTGTKLCLTASVEQHDASWPVNCAFGPAKFGRI